MYPLRWVAGYFFPNWVFPRENDRKFHYPLWDKLASTLRESGYFHIQATKPDTIGHGLTDSPVGLAAYILEKFTIATDPDSINHQDGKLTQYFEMDELLNNVMVYWISGSITSSMRLYKEAVSLLFTTDYQSRQSTVPLGYASFPNEISGTPEHWLKYKYTNVVSYTAMPAGGHFAAVEQPRLLAEDIRKFSRAAEDFWRKQS